MSANINCSCGVAPTLIFTCSGASDVGEIADRATRQLMRQGAGKMYCLAGVGGRVSGILLSTQAADSLLAIDGCPLACAKHTLEQAGIQQFRHLRLSDLGMVKGESPVTDDRISKVVEAGRDVLRNETPKL